MDVDPQGRGETLQNEAFRTSDDYRLLFYVPVRDIDFTNPTYPNGTMRPGHPGPPHQHRWHPVDPNHPAAGWWRDRAPQPYP